MKLPSVLAATLALAAQPAQAQIFAVDTDTHRVLETPPESLTAAVLGRMCSAKGAMQYEWGQTGVPLSSRIMETLGLSMNLPETLAPFEKARPRSTPWSDKLAWMSYWVVVGQGDDVQAGYEDFMAGLLPLIEEEGWQPVPGGSEELPIAYGAFVGDHVFDRHVDNGKGAERQFLSISKFMGQVDLTCGSASLSMQNAEEAFGKLPDGTPRPVRDEIDLPPRYGEQACGDPNFAQQVFDQGKASPPSAYLSALLRRQDYSSRLVQWMSWKIEQSGTMSEQETLSLLMGGNVSNSMMSALENIGAIIPASQALWDTRAANDRPGYCVAVVRMQDLIARIDDAGTEMNAAAIQALEQAATRKGVSLD